MLNHRAADRSSATENDLPVRLDMMPMVTCHRNEEVFNQRAPASYNAAHGSPQRESRLGLSPPDLARLD